MKPILLSVILLLFSLTVVSAQDDDTRYYDVGAPTLVDVYVDPVNGNDANAGDSEQTALHTLTEAWNRIPMGVELMTGYHLHLLEGDYTEETIPVYWESRYATFEYPILIEGGSGTILSAPINLFDSRYVYFTGFALSPGVDAFHCERCDHVLLRDLFIVGADPETYQAQETVKVNQSTHFYIEDSTISGAWNVTVDFVAVQYGHVIGNTIMDAGDWCMYFKGGSAYITVESNWISGCGNGGFSAGQGTGFQYMEQPFIQYEAYYIRFVNNFVHNTSGAGVGVQGGYNILIAYNTFSGIGARSHIVEIGFGARSCDGGTDDPSRARCDEYLAPGGWGNTLIADGDNFTRIPNKHVFIYNNVFYNAEGEQSQWQHFTIYAPFTGEFQNGANVPVPTLTDDDLRIVGNVIWNGGADHPLGLGENSGCAADNPTCNEDQLRRDNAINTIDPQLVNGTWIPRVDLPDPAALPPFIADDPRVPPPDDLQNSVSIDLEGRARTDDVIGAFVLP